MSGRKVFTAGEVLQAADVNDFLMDQSVMVFAGTAARGSAIPSPSEGMVTYLSDSDQVQVYNGSSFGPIGTILQVVSTTKTDTFTTTSSTYTNITGLSASITPSSTNSKILIFMNVHTGAEPSTTAVNLQLLRDSTPISIGDAAGSRTRATTNPTSSGGSQPSNAANFLDSPNTTSAVTYAVQIRTTVSAQSVYVNRSQDDGDIDGRARTASTITLMEVAG